MEERRVKKSNSLKGNTKIPSMNKIQNPKRKESSGQGTSNAEGFLNKIINNTFSPVTNFKHRKKLSSSNINTEKALIEKLSMDILKKDYEKYPNGDISQKPFGIIKSFAFNSYHGIYKEENEDKICVCEQIKKPPNSKSRIWPKLSFFAIFDGHGGETCSSYLKNNFLNYLLEDKNFPIDIKASLISTIERCENEFNKKYNDDLSGSCALICVISDNKIFFCNVGDSRAIMSMDNGKKIRPLTIDHKPNNPKDYERIIKCGGKVYIDNDNPERDLTQMTVINNEKEFDKYINDPEIVYRIYPCDLAVSRTIGDLKAKKKELGGLPGQVVSTPDVYVFDNSSNLDFIIMGCDGIFDCLSNNDIIDCAWYAIQNTCKARNNDINYISLDMCDMIIKNSMDKMSGDNLSVVIIGLEGLEKYLVNKINREKVVKTFKK